MACRLRHTVSSAAYGACFGIFPISWIVFWALVLYEITVRTGKFEVIKDSIGSITSDKRMQALLIAFAFGAFIEGCAGFGTPVAVAAAMMVGLGFSALYASSICLLANTAPVAFGSIGIPVITLAGITGLPLERVNGVAGLSGVAGTLTAPIAFILPAYLILVTSGLPAMLEVWPAVLTCGAVFATIHFLRVELHWSAVDRHPQFNRRDGRIGAAAALLGAEAYRRARTRSRRIDEDAPRMSCRCASMMSGPGRIIDARDLAGLDALRAIGGLRAGLGLSGHSQRC